jgi:hypothetical protein
VAPLVLALAVLSLPAGTARYRVEVGGVPIGVAELRVTCDRAGCAASWSTRLRSPEAAGGRVAERTTRAEVDRAGRLAGAVTIEEDGARTPGATAPGAIPAMLAETLLLASVREAGRACVDVLDEASGRAERACAERRGDGVAARVLGVEEELAADPDGFPARVVVPAQQARYVRDARAEVPAAVALEVRVPGPDDPRAATRFCGVPRDPPPGRAPAAAPAPRARGGSCREKAAVWARAAAARGLDARVAVGVAHDGGGFVWHAWAEVREGAAWIPVDPSFGEAPARGPRFTLARFAPGDAGGRDAAGRAILRCWGRARVE